MKVIVIDKKSKKWAKLNKAHLVNAKALYLSILLNEWKNQDLEIALTNDLKTLITHNTIYNHWLVYPEECPYELGYFFAGRWYEIESRIALYHPKFGWML